MAKEWYKEWFSSKFYLELYKHRDETDARKLINLILTALNLPAGSKILDICCGAGRHSVELARRGYAVTGFDLSEFLISQANRNRDKIRTRNLKVKFLIRDMRKFDFRKKFDLALNLFTSFGYFENDIENFSVFKNASLSLKPGGFFVFDFLNGNYLKKHLKHVTKTQISGKKVLQKRRIENDFVIKDILIQNGKNDLAYCEKLKLYTPDRFRRAFRKEGFRIIRISGDYSGNDFNSEKSQRIIIFAKKN